MDKLFNATRFGEKLKNIGLKSIYRRWNWQKKIDLQTSSVSHLENGTHSPSLETLLRLSSVLEVGIDEMLYDRLPAVREHHLDKDIQNLFVGCSAEEKELLLRILQTVKQTLKERR